MLVECGNCGAPLDVEGDPTFVKCGYCERSNKVKSLRTLSAQTPSSWRAPAQWSPPHAPSPRPLPYVPPSRTGAAAMSGCVVWSFALVLVGAIGAVVFAVAVPSAPSSFGVPDGVYSPPGFGAASWDGSAPFTCGGNEVVSLSNVDASLPGQTAITVTANCQLTLDGVRVNAARGIVGSGNGRVVVRNSSFQTTGAGIRLDGNRLLELRGSTVIAEEAAIDLAGNTQATVDDCTIGGKPRAVIERANASATLTRTIEQ